MPRYFFHVIDGRALVDTTGLLFGSEAGARHEALRGAGQMLAGEGMNLWLGNKWTMTVTDEDSFVLFNLNFSAEKSKRQPVGSNGAG